MRSFQKSNRLRNLMQSRFFLAFLGIIIIIFIFNTFGLVRKMEETRRNRKIAEERITELEISKENLSREIVKLKTEEGVEESIREKFGVAKDGENMILIIEDKNEVDIDQKADSSGFFDFIKNWFK